MGCFWLWRVFRLVHMDVTVPGFNVNIKPTRECAVCPLSAFTHGCSLLTHELHTDWHTDVWWITVVHTVAASFCYWAVYLMRASAERVCITAAEHSLVYCAGWNTVFLSVSTRWEEHSALSPTVISLCLWQLWIPWERRIFLFLFSSQPITGHLLCRCVLWWLQSLWLSTVVGALT